MVLETEAPKVRLPKALELPRTIEKVMVFAGLTGVRVAKVLDMASNYLYNAGRRPFKAKYEDYLILVSGMAEIESIVAEILSSSMDAVRKKFLKALDAVLQDAERANADVLLLGVHLTYYSRGLITPNPIIWEIFSLAAKGALVYLVEDYYDALYRISGYWVAQSQRFRERVIKHPYALDPLTYLYWRGAEMNLLNALSSALLTIRIILFGVKHPPEALKTLIDDVVLDRCVIHIYLSHPISIFRTLRELAAKKIPLRDAPGVQEIEAIAEILRRTRIKWKALSNKVKYWCSILVYQPTTIDELIQEKVGEIAKKIKNCSPPPSRSARRTIDPIIDSNNRWPFNGIHNDYKHKTSTLDLLNDPSLKATMGAALESMKDDICQGRGFYVSLIEDLIKAQIEVRDYWYVDQADAILAVIPLFYEIKKDNGECKFIGYLHLSEGVEAEVRRAHALSKRLAAALLPLSLDQLVDTLCGNSNTCVENVKDNITKSSRKIYELKGKCDEGPDKFIESIASDLVRGSGRGRPLSPLGVVDGVAVVLNGDEVKLLFTP